MSREREVSEIFLHIKRDVREFDRETFLEDAKFDVFNIYNMLKNDEQDKLVQNHPYLMVQKILDNKYKYRINENIDHISVQYIELDDYIVEDDEKYIKLYLSVYFYDNARNNDIPLHGKDKYWNDIWIVTYKYYESEVEEIYNNCKNCGGNMKYYKDADMFKCNYCGSTRRNINFAKWKIYDIEVEQ